MYMSEGLIKIYFKVKVIYICNYNAGVICIQYHTIIFI
jgi:hypothetical protein